MNYLHICVTYFREVRDRFYGINLFILLEKPISEHVYQEITEFIAIMSPITEKFSPRIAGRTVFMAFVSVNGKYFC